LFLGIELLFRISIDIEIWNVNPERGGDQLRPTPNEVELEIG
jgi:hypothetical protein